MTNCQHCGQPAQRCRAQMLKLETAQIPDNRLPCLLRVNDEVTLEAQELRGKTDSLYDLAADADYDRQMVLLDRPDDWLSCNEQAFADDCRQRGRDLQ